MNVKDFREGDIVEARKGSRVVRDVVVDWNGPVFSREGYLGAPSIFAPSTLGSYHRLGYKLSLVGRPAPKLPTEPGVYESEKYPLLEGNAAYVLEDGVWYVECREQSEDDMRRSMPLRRWEVVV